MSVRNILLRRNHISRPTERRQKDLENRPDGTVEPALQAKEERFTGGFPTFTDSDSSREPNQLDEVGQSIADQQLAMRNTLSESATLVRTERTVEPSLESIKEGLPEVSEPIHNYYDYGRPNELGEGENRLRDQQLAMLNVPSERADPFWPEYRDESELEVEQSGLPEVSQCLADLNDPGRADRLGQDGKLVTDQQLALDTGAREPAVSVKPEDERQPKVGAEEKGLPEVSERLPDVDESGGSNRLSEDEKLFVVQQLAMYRTPSETATLVKVKFGKDVSRQAVRRYSPEARRVGKKWREIFDTTRQKYLQEIADIGVADPVYRLRILQECLNHEKRKPVPDQRIIYRIIAHAAFESAGRPLVERGDLRHDFQFAFFSF